MSCEQFLDDLPTRVRDYQVYERGPGELALRQRVTYSNPNGFDEFRFLCIGNTRRVYAMFANLDSEMAVHPGLVKTLHSVANAAPKWRSLHQ
jgi:hypothetical protein